MPMRIPTPLLTLAVIAGMLGLPHTTAAAQSSSTPGTVASSNPRAVGETHAGLSVTAVPAASGVLRPGEDLTVSITLSNRSSAAVPAATAAISLDRSAVSDRAELAEWFAPDAVTEGEETDDKLGDPVATVATPQLLAGESVALPPVVLPAAALGFDPAARFGAHRLEVSVSTGDGRLGRAKSSVVADPGTGFEATPLTIAMPLAIPASSVGLIPADLLAIYTDVDGLLSLQLDQAFARPGVAIGIDPRIIASIRILGDSAPESATAWLRRLELAPNETFPLAYADTDVAATSQSNAVVLAPIGFAIDAALFPPETPAEQDEQQGQNEEAPEPTGPAQPDVGSPSPSTPPVDPDVPTDDTLLDWDYTRTGIVWPRDSTVVRSDLGVFAAAGYDTTIVASANSTPTESDSDDSSARTPGAATTVDGNAVLTSDSMLSTRLREAVRASTDLDWESAMARLSATLATLAAEPAGEARIELATLDRNSPLGGFQLARTLAAVDALPWSIPAELGGAIAQPPVAASILDSPVAVDRIARLQSLMASEAAAAQFATVLADPTLVTGERRLSLLALASQSWTVDETGWPTASDEYLARTNEITTSVQVADGSTFQLLATNGELPIPISNSLPYPVTVFVTVRPERAILAVRQSPVEITIEADSQSRALVPVESIANGEVTVTITLTSAAGVPISQPTLAEINVQAGWETAVTAVLFVLVIVVFVLGIIRTIRRRRRARRAPDAAAAAVGANAVGSDHE